VNETFLLQLNPDIADKELIFTGDTLKLPCEGEVVLCVGVVVVVVGGGGDRVYARTWLPELTATRP
jgi:hypothetical protein